MGHRNISSAEQAAGTSELRPETNSKAARAITRTETHDQTEHDTNSNHTCGQLCGTMSWTAGRIGRQH